MEALCASLEVMFRVMTGKELKTIAFGKLQLGTSQFATRLLQQCRKDTTLRINSPSDTLYFVGHTPESDIRGTNEFDGSDVAANTDWYSILVRTGVFKEGGKPKSCRLSTWHATRVRQVFNSCGCSGARD